MLIFCKHEDIFKKKLFFFLFPVSILIIIQSLTIECDVIYSIRKCSYATDSEIVFIFNLCLGARYKNEKTHLFTDLNGFWFSVLSSSSPTFDLSASYLDLFLLLQFHLPIWFNKRCKETTCSLPLRIKSIKLEFILRFRSKIMCSMHDSYFRRIIKFDENLITLNFYHWKTKTYLFEQILIFYSNWTD